jgi:murein DD-endopeptidase MepM/ murein hydrolase activator NlpD
MDITNVRVKALNQADSPEAERQQIKVLAQQFEAMLVTQMLREMRKSMLDDESDASDGFGTDALMDTGNIELGQALSRAGGVGLTDALLAAFENQVAPASHGSAEPAGLADKLPLANRSSAALLPDTAPAAGSAGFALEDITAAAPVSSQFGWRQDPLTGIQRFHKGVDIAVAYGHDVKAAAKGTVAFAGVQNGYGETVVIDHPDGRQTRYAHLSEPLVHAGDAVAEGQIVGKSGNSGRSTGPHLHFEVLVHGHPVDPTSTGA